MSATSDAGIAQAIVRRPTGFPPEDKTVLWFEQTDPNPLLNPDVGILRWFNSDTQSWEKLYPDEATKWFDQDIEVAMDDETEFTLDHIVVNPSVSFASVAEIGDLLYGVDYTIDGSALTFIPHITGGSNFRLKAGDILQVRAMW